MNINRNNYEAYFISYIENELNNTQRKAVEDFVAMNPDLKNELELFGATKLEADEKIIFADKESLLQKNSTKIIAWKWNINVWASAAILLLLLGVGWWMMNQSAVKSHQFSEEKINVKSDSVKSSELRIRNSELIKTEKHYLAKNNFAKTKRVENKNFNAKIILPETIDTAELPNSWTSRKKWNEEHEIHVVQEIKPEEILQVQKNVAEIDTIKAVAQNAISVPPTKKTEEKMIAQIPFKTSKNERQILKMLAWASSKVLGKETNNGNFDVSIGFAEISHKQALQDN